MHAISSHGGSEHSGTGRMPRSAGAAFVLGLLFGGVAFFYTRPFRRAWLPALAGYLIVAVSGGILWVPVFLTVAFLAAREAKFSDGRMAFDDAENSFGDEMHESRQTAPSLYVRVRRK